MSYISCHIHVELGEDVPATQGFLCGPCFQRTGAMLQEIGDLYEWIRDPHYLAGTREPASFYTKSRPPVSLNAVSILDPRSRYQRKGDPVSPERVIRAWRNAAGDALSGSWTEIYDGRTVPVMVAELQSALPWIAGAPAVVRFARHVGCVLHSMRKEVGDLKEESDGDGSE